MTQYWTIVDVATGAVVEPSFATSAVGVHPRFEGFAWDAARHKATRIAGTPDPAAQEWNGTAWVDAPALVEGALIALVKAEAERRKMLALTPGGAKKTEYADKAAEVRTWHTLGGTLTGVVAVLGLVAGAKMRATFPYAIADAAAFGDTIDKAIARFSAGMTTSATVPTIAAVEAKACAAIKAASTTAGKRAAANVTWP